MPWWAEALIGIGAALLMCWLVLIAMLSRAQPGRAVVREALRILPDTLRLIAALARDRALPRGVRVRLWMLLGYLALPIDVVPDFIPVIGYADDILAIGWVLRSVIRRAGVDAVSAHWSGSPRGLAVLIRLAGARRTVVARDGGSSE